MVADAKSRIAVYGHSQVISALATFLRTDQKLISTSDCEAFRLPTSVTNRGSGTVRFPVRLSH